MGGVASYILHRSDEIVLSACVDQILSRPLAEVTVKSVVLASGLTEWRAYRAVHIDRNRFFSRRQMLSPLRARQLCARVRITGHGGAEEQSCQLSISPVQNVTVA